jgi:two-component system, chemotaxis family, CheB/CheR fusion protein
MVQETRNAQFEVNLLAMNEALLLGSLRQHELAAASELLNLKLEREITGRKQVEATLRESEERFHMLFEMAPIGVYSCDASGMIKDFNRRAAELWGREPRLGDPDERFCGSFKLFRPDGSSMPREQCPMADVLTGKIPEARDMEVDMERNNGTRFSAIVNIRPLQNQRGEITGAINCFYDITERKGNEAAVRASEAQYRTLFNSIDEGFCIIEKIATQPGEPMDFLYLEANPAFEKQSGVSNVVGRSVREVFPGEPQEWINTYATIVRDGEPVRIEREFVTQGRLLELYVFRLEDVAQQRLAIIFQDITSRKQGEALARRLAAIVQSSDDAIWSTDIDGTIISWNPGAEHLLGYSATEIAGKSFAMLLPADRKNEKAMILARIRDGEHVDHSETALLTKDGKEIWVSLSASPLTNAEGDVVGASKIVRDITLRRLADEHRNILVGELNHRAKNSLAMVRAIAAQTLKGALSLEEAQLAFESRLEALARGHDLLTFGNWAGTDLSSVAKATVEPHGGGESRFHIEGPFVSLTPATALTFTMALHELCTNAVKYGALSDSLGTVSIVWQVISNGDESLLNLQWTERGGPTVTPPIRKGFGSRLVERALAMELSGEVRIHYEPTGVVCIIDAPLPRFDVKVYQNIA